MSIVFNFKSIPIDLSAGKENPRQTAAVESAGITLIGAGLVAPKIIERLNAGLVAPKIIERLNMELTCRQCQRKYEDNSEKPRLICPQCYQVFLDNCSIQDDWAKNLKVEPILLKPQTLRLGDMAY